MTTAFQSAAFQNNAFQIDATVVATVTDAPAFNQEILPFRKSRQGWKRIRRSDFKSLEAYEAALKKQLVIIPIPVTVIVDDEDDDAILMALVSRILH